MNMPYKLVKLRKTNFRFANIMKSIDFRQKYFLIPYPSLSCLAIWIEGIAVKVDVVGSSLTTNNIYIKSNVKNNLTMQEQEALKILRTNSEIIIKEADKGGATIIMNKEDYKELVETILNDEVYYTKLNTSPEKELNLKYKKFLQKFKSQMTEKEFDYLLNFEVKTSNFYGLPKVHKSKQINEKCKSANSGYVEITDKISDLKLRPIVAGPSCHTHRLSNLIDILLRPYTELSLAI